ncbi:MAG: tRNA lysidine(34) synthetase TilS [Verrucomicrobia bacterium]|nr:tRNA lysidine(34) synthetase TilS [Verrucomicrobiota bacterium]
MSNLVDHIEESILTRRLFRRGQSILVAVSGGLDSMVLLYSLHQLAAKQNWRLVVAHFNHQLRGRSSDADETLVRQTATTLKLPIVVERAHVKQFAAQRGLSVEMAARRLRHEFFARTTRTLNSQLSTLNSPFVVALAHHADDQVELFFLRLLRGTGGEGLAGMKWVTGLSILNSQRSTKLRLVRPLLDLDKAALAGFARQQGIKFREDASNRSVEFLRNRIRHELIPLLRKHYQPALDRTTLRLMEIVGQEAAFVTQTASAWLNSHLPTHSPANLRSSKVGKWESGKVAKTLSLTLNSHLSSLNFLDLPVAVQRRVVQLQLLELGVAGDFDLVEELRGATDRVITVTPQLSLYRDSSGRIHTTRPETNPFESAQTTLEFTGKKGRTVFDCVKIQWQIEPGGLPSFRPSTLNSQPSTFPCEHFDADKVGSPIVLRHWQPGDRFQPIGMSSRVKLQDLFTNQKIPRSERRGLIVAVSATGELFWVEGMRISELFKLDKRTVRRLKWEWRRR